MESYRTVQGTAEAELEDRRSRFIAQLSFADTEEKALAFLDTVRAKHKTASHNVYAYVLREGAKQADAGADVLDVNVGLPGIDEKAMLPRRKPAACPRWRPYATRA